jgi:tRNA pseudouridine38-40 synthase
MRYFIEASYLGTQYAGWQRQPGDPSVQQTLEEAFSLILREEIQITGCGRTDAGVHAKQYYFHFDTEQDFTADLLKRFNKYLPVDIALLDAYVVDAEANTRFDAIRRTYQYHITFQKDPLNRETVLWYPHQENLDFGLMQDLATLLLEYDAFKTFCKEGSDATHYTCQLNTAQWDFSERGAVFTISANRFLRGMVRLIVGACLQVGRGRVSVEDVRQALDAQAPLQYAESIAAHGLHLVKVDYPEGMI